MMNPKFYFKEIPDGGSGGPGFMWKKEEFTILCDCSEADSIHISVPSSWVIENNYRYNFIYKIKGADGDFHNTSTWSAEGDEITGSYDGGTFIHHGVTFDNFAGASGGGDIPVLHFAWGTPNYDTGTIGYSTTNFSIDNGYTGVVRITFEEPPQLQNGWTYVDRLSNTIGFAIEGNAYGIMQDGGEAYFKDAASFNPSHSNPNWNGGCVIEEGLT